jgi:hypothetical protein
MSENLDTLNASQQNLLQPFAEVNKVGLLAPFSWVKKGTRDLLVCQFSSMFYGTTFALLGWTIAFFYGTAYGGFHAAGALAGYRAVCTFTTKRAW